MAFFFVLEFLLELFIVFRYIIIPPCPLPKPPSTITDAPVINEASSPDKKTAPVTTTIRLLSFMFVTLLKCFNNSQQLNELYRT